MREVESSAADPNEVKAGFYQHYKGNRYLVLGVSLHSETEELTVVYVPLYLHSGPGLSNRPLEMFLGNVVVDGVEQHRFRYLGSMGEVGESGANNGKGK
jgi:hypothetical protein